ncbi:MAG: hypothetical protein HYT22_03100 [Candidatus Niyogibacteria bacterium]|nr:hypothetical protein [Candidatus Niyogibacteria bacterium]
MNGNAYLVADHVALAWGSLISEFVEAVCEGLGVEKPRDSWTGYLRNVEDPWVRWRYDIPCFGLRLCIAVNGYEVRAARVVLVPCRKANEGAAISHIIGFAKTGEDLLWLVPEVIARLNLSQKAA